MRADKQGKWSGRPDLNRGPPAPKSGVPSLGSPSFSIFVLKINELEKYLVAARCTEMWPRMHGVPRIFPIAKQQRNGSDRFRLSRRHESVIGTRVCGGLLIHSD